MGTSLQILFSAEKKADAAHAFAHAVPVAQTWERTCSRFLPDSELSQLNRGAISQVSELFWEVFEESQHWYDFSGGLFNPLLSPVHLGYKHDFFRGKNAFSDQPDKNANFNFSPLKTKSDSREIFLSAGQKLDFGGFLKGFLAEKLAHLMLEQSGITGVLVNLGGDLFAVGSEPGADGFRVELKSPHDQQDSIFIELPPNTALSTSGTMRRRWGTRAHHILSPEGGASARSDLVSASVISRCGAGADALATVAIVLGKIAAIDFLQSRGLLFVLFDDQGGVHSQLKKS